MLLWCRLQNPKLDLLFGSAQGLGVRSDRPTRTQANINQEPLHRAQSHRALLIRASTGRTPIYINSHMELNLKRRPSRRPVVYKGPFSSFDDCLAKCRGSSCSNHHGIAVASNKLEHGCKMLHAEISSFVGLRVGGQSCSNFWVSTAGPQNHIKYGYP